MSKSTEPLRLSLELRIPEGSSYEDILAIATRALSSLSKMPPPAPGASIVVRDGQQAIGGIHLRAAGGPL